MFVILTYDVSEKKVNKVRKALKKYLTWTQNSVFEGEISDAILQKCMLEISGIIDKMSDSVYIYVIENSRNVKKSKIGIEKAFDETII
ncbi:MAG TPA: CRISPR-associated endonuclease Cas2 [Pseudobacteroides sp.]|uniref:CRISPR-associated endonuclease Cas2 n=1 Tax=Pseudobacteroides sp. TaxID=1968840 RepID=UPI002F9491BA